MPAGETLKRYYPGLTPKETALWRSFLREHELDWESFEYHVYVGAGVPLPPEKLGSPDPVVQAYVRQWREATQKKIDALGVRGNETWIFEVEERPGTIAAGQIVSYQELLPRTREVLGPIIPAVVCAILEPDFVTVAEALGVFVWQVTPPAE